MWIGARAASPLATAATNEERYRYSPSSSSIGWCFLRSTARKHYACPVECRPQLGVTFDLETITMSTWSAASAGHHQRVGVARVR